MVPADGGTWCGASEWVLSQPAAAQAAELPVAAGGWGGAGAMPQSYGPAIGTVSRPAGVLQAAGARSARPFVFTAGLEQGWRAPAARAVTLEAPQSPLAPPESAGAGSRHKRRSQNATAGSCETSE